MKKIFCLMLALVFVFSFAGCGNGDETDTSSVASRAAEIEEYIKKGSIPEIPFAVGTDVDDVEDYYNDMMEQLEAEHSDDEGHIHSDDDIYFEVTKGNLSVTMDTGKMKYFYEKAKKSKGVSVILTFEDAFGFEVMYTTKNDIEEALSGLSGKTLSATEDDLYFLSYASEAIILRYEIDRYRLDFYFDDNTLMATVLQNTENWTI